MRRPKRRFIFFEAMLREDHLLTDFAVAGSDSASIELQYTLEGATHSHLFDREAAEQLLFDIESNPVYNNTVQSAKPRSK